MISISWHVSRMGSFMAIPSSYWVQKAINDGNFLKWRSWKARFFFIDAWRPFAVVPVPERPFKTVVASLPLFHLTGEVKRLVELAQTDMISSRQGALYWEDSPCCPAGSKSKSWPGRNQHSGCLQFSNFSADESRLKKRNGSQNVAKKIAGGKAGGTTRWCEESLSDCRLRESIHVKSGLSEKSLHLKPPPGPSQREHGRQLASIQCASRT